MLVNIEISKVSEEKLSEYRKNLAEVYGEGEPPIKVFAEMYQMDNLSTEVTRLEDNTGLYPVRFDMSLSHQELLPEGIKIIKYPHCLPALVTQINYDKYNRIVETNSRLNKYGYCESFTDFMKIAGNQLNASQRNFLVTFSYIKGYERVSSEVDRGSLIRSDHTVPITSNQIEGILHYHVYEVVSSDYEDITSDQAFELLGMDLRGEAINTEDLRSNFYK